MPSGEVTVPGMRLRELTQHSYGVRVRFHLAATVVPGPAEVVIEHFASGLTFILRFADEPDWDGPLRKVPSLKRYFQGVLHYSALKTGFAFVAISLGTIAGAGAASRLLAPFEPRALPMGRP
jgi:hypothetical protein